MIKEKSTITYYDERGKEITKSLNIINGRKLISKIKEIAYTQNDKALFYFKNVDFTKYFAEKIVFDQNNNSILILENCIFNELEIIDGQAQIINCRSKNKSLNIKTSLMNDIDIIINENHEINYDLNIGSRKIFIDGKNKEIKSLQMWNYHQMKLQNIKVRDESKDFYNFNSYNGKVIINNSNMNLYSFRVRNLVLNNSKIKTYASIAINELSGQDYTLETIEGEIIIGNTIYEKEVIITDSYLKDEKQKLTRRLISDLKGIEKYVKECIKTETNKEQEIYQKKIETLNGEIQKTKSRCKTKCKKLERKLNDSSITQFIKKDINDATIFCQREKR